MERLTRKFTQEDYDKERIQLDEIGLTNAEISEKVGEDYLLNEDVMGTNAPMHKLGKLEDIEEEFGIDLIKLLKAKTIYTKHKEISKCIVEDINFEFKYIRYNYSYQYSYTEYFKDYGKTWAFTREELEKCITKQD